MAKPTKTTKRTVKKASSTSKNSSAEKWLKAYLKARYSKPEDRNNSREELMALEAELLKTL